MFRRNAIGESAGLIEIVDLNQSAATLERGGNHLAARHGRQQSFDTGRDLRNEFGIRTQQNRLRQFVMLGLGEQVNGDPVRIGRGIGDDQHFRWSGHHVDADGAEDATLGRRHVGIAGTDDLVHLRDGLRAVGQRRHGLRAADSEYAVDADQAGGGQHQRILLAARSRHDHDQFADSRHLGRQRIHQHRTRVGRLAARHVKADPVQRRDFLPESRTVGFGVAPRFEFLSLVIRRYALRRRFERGTLGSSEAVERLPQLTAGQVELGHDADVEMIEAARVFQHCHIALRAHLGKNAGNRLLDGIASQIIEVQQRVERCEKARIAGRQAANHRASVGPPQGGAVLSFRSKQGLRTMVTPFLGKGIEGKAFILLQPRWRR